MARIRKSAQQAQMLSFAKVPEIAEKHAIMSPSSYHWIDYDDARFREWVASVRAKETGTRLHSYAEQAIALGRRQIGGKNADSVAMHINDAIDLGLTPEVPLFYSWSCYGHADAMGFDGTTLRIHDLKTGKIAGDMRQLRIYAALFYLQYGDVVGGPEQYTTILRIYQNNSVSEEVADPQMISDYMGRIVEKCMIYEEL